MSLILLLYNLKLLRSVSLILFQHRTVVYMSFVRLGQTAWSQG